nr:MAG TPA: hypothetical protein [Caudoviricetes sp.]
MYRKRDRLKNKLPSRCLAGGDRRECAAARAAHWRV